MKSFREGFADFCIVSEECFCPGTWTISIWEKKDMRSKTHMERLMTQIDTLEQTHVSGSSLLAMHAA